MRNRILIPLAMVSPGKFKFLRDHQGWRRQLQLDTSRTHCRSSDLGGCPWLVLACLGLSCLCCFVSGAFLSSPRLLCNLIPRQNKSAKPLNPLRTNPVRTWGYHCSYFPYFSTYSTSCMVSSDHVGSSLISWISDIALGIEGYRFRHRYGDQKMGDLRCIFQVTRNSDKLHVTILLLDSGFGETSVTAQGCSFNISQHGHYLNQHHYHHHHHHHQHHYHHQAHDALWINFLHTL